MYYFWSSIRGEYKIFITGDSQSAILSLCSTPKDILHRSTQSKVLDMSLALSSKYPKIKLYFSWVRSEELPADYNSKISQNIIEKSNSDFWRHGPPIFLNESEMFNRSYLFFNPETKSLDHIKKL